MSLTSYTFAQLLTFARASTKMLFNGSGVLTQVASGQPGFSYDPVTFAARGLSVEGSATNLIPNGALPATGVTAKLGVTMTQTTAGPDGTQSMVLLQCDTSTGNHYGQANFTVNLQQVVTHEFYIKASAFSKVRVSLVDQQTPANSLIGIYDLVALTATYQAGGTALGMGATLTAVGNGIYKATLTGQPTTNTSQTSILLQYVLPNAAGTLSYTGDGTSGVYIGGLSLKAAAIPSSYIPNTTASATTRAADVCSITSLSPWFNASAGTVFVQARIPNTAPAGKNQVLLRLDDGTDNNKIEIRNLGGTSNVEVLIVSGGTTVFQQVGGTFAAGTVVAAAVSYASNAFGISVGGNTTISGASGAVPQGVTRCVLGASDLAGSNALNGELQDVNYYPVAMSATDLQALT